MSQPDPLSEDLRTFLVDTVQTYEQLEALLLLYRSSAEWTPTRVADNLDIDSESALAALLHLEAHQLLGTHAGRFYFRPADKVLADRTAALSVAYESARIAVLGVLSTNALERIRSAGLRLFAAAFRMRDKGSK